ncbi:hypothetical protein NUW58_g3483 [Xylaria curta]|uniref:Uncharacterized protein n=1 Tax=Xylaria curta TaxID=42375 RepID=A0ACC1PCD4_9PEZI|nr:hypothetical protein NUW58_g3483 [Xylaria curta]
MARRKRRAKPLPTTIDYKETARHYKETSILKPVSPSTHTDDWPCFLLSDASVHRRDASLASQLNADLEGPFIVRGKLELEKDNERYLINRHMKTKDLWIQIESSRAFSVGAKDDSLSVPVVWASGEAGWFEIVPAPSYRRICDEMFQAVCLHYSLLDQYEAALEKLQKSKKKKKATFADVSIDLDELLFQARIDRDFLYALRAGDGLTLPEAHKRFHLQSTFLMSHFPKDTGVYKYLADRYPVVARNILNKGATNGPRWDKMFVNIPCALVAYDYSQREKSSSREVSDGKKKGKGRNRNSAPRTTRASETSDIEVVGPPNKNNKTYPSRSARMKKKSIAEIPPADDDIIMIDSSSNNPAPSKPLHGLQGETHDNNSTVGSNTTKGAKTSCHVLVDALEDVRKNMLQLINEGRQKKQLSQFTAKSWQTKVYMECNIKRYDSVQEIFHYHARDLVQHLGPEWHDTQIYQWAKEQISKPLTLTLISEADVNRIVRRVKKSAQSAHAEKVVTENPPPEASQYAGKQTPRGRPSGKAAGLRPSTGSKKRLRHEADFEDSMDLDEDGIPKKRSKRSHYFTDEDDDDDVDDDNNSIDEDDEDSSSESKARIDKDNVPMTQLVIRAEKLPSTQPQGPNQTWVCEEPDCRYVVRAAHEEKGRKLISAHYEEHEKEAQDVAQEIALNRVNLAVQEARGHMPIKYAYIPPFLILVEYDGEAAAHLQPRKGLV